jgi:phosphatidylinositol dimannoside acyltransferase
LLASQGSAAFAFGRVEDPGEPEKAVKSGASRWPDRLGVFGDLPTRLLAHSLQITPWFLEPALVLGWTGLFFGIAAKQRRAVASNLRALFPHWGTARATLGAWRVFWNFAVTYVDAMRSNTGTGSLDWTIEGLRHMEELSQRTDGCIVLTAHMGNYDIAAPVFASRFRRTLYTVRAPEREPETQKIREEELRLKEQKYPHFRTLFNREGGLLGVELARLLTEGNIVAIQGDRVIFDVSPMEVEVRPGLWMRLPKGPLFLARVSGAPCYPLFITRDGWRRYRVSVHAPIELPPRKRGDEAVVAEIWAKAVFDPASRFWPQWFVFEEFLSRKKGPN